MAARRPLLPRSPRPRPRGARRLAALAIGALPLALGACEWFTDFKHQPRLEPWEQVAGDTIPFRGNPAGSVPIYGNLVPVYRVSYAALPTTIDSMSDLSNPFLPDSASLARGRKLYAINCAVCHGDDAAGSKLPLMQKYGLAVSLQTPSARGRTDGYIFGMIRNGRGLMPTYDRIEEPDRWHVANYLKGLQGRLGGPVAQGPLGRPGETGNTLVGPTISSPTRPVPHVAVPGPERLPAIPSFPAVVAPSPGGSPPTVPTGIPQFHPDTITPAPAGGTP